MPEDAAPLYHALIREIAERMVRDGQATTVEDAERRLQANREKRARRLERMAAQPAPPRATPGRPSKHPPAIPMSVFEMLREFAGV